MRRRADDWINATHILKVAEYDKPSRTRILEREVQKGVHEKVQGGYGKYQGTMELHLMASWTYTSKSNWVRNMDTSSRRQATRRAQQCVGEDASDIRLRARRQDTSTSTQACNCCVRKAAHAARCCAAETSTASNPYDLTSTCLCNATLANVHQRPICHRLNLTNSRHNCTIPELSLQRAV